MGHLRENEYKMYIFPEIQLNPSDIIYLASIHCIDTDVKYLLPPTNYLWEFIFTVKFVGNMNRSGSMGHIRKAGKIMRQIYLGIKLKYNVQTTAKDELSYI